MIQVGPVIQNIRSGSSSCFVAEEIGLVVANLISDRKLGKNFD